MRSAEEILARRLDQVLPPDTTSLPPLTPDPLVNTAARFARIGIGEPSDVALARMEAVVMAAFDRQYRLQRRQPRHWAAQVAKWAVAACLVFALLVAGAVPASAGSLPGEPLYWVKLAAERVELTLATTPESAAFVHLTHAERRATEVLGLLDRSQYDETLLNAALTEVQTAAQLAPAEMASSRTYQWQYQQVSALVQYAAVQAEESGFDISPNFDRLPTLEPPVIVVPCDETPVVCTTATPTSTPSATATMTATASHTPSATSTTTSTPTATATMTATASYTPSASATTPDSTASRAPSSTTTPRRTATRTPVTQATLTPWPSEEPEAAIACPGNSCDSAGVPGGQIDPDAPPGQSGGRDDNPPDPPGQGDPGGGQDNSPGQGISENNSGGSSQGQPPSDSGGNSGNGQGNSGNSSGNSGNGQGNSGNGNSGNGQGN